MQVKADIDHNQRTECRQRLVCAIEQLQQEYSREWTRLSATVAGLKKHMLLICDHLLLMMFVSICICVRRFTFRNRTQSAMDTMLTWIHSCLHLVCNFTDSLVSLHHFPPKLNPLIQSLMKSIKTESDPVWQQRSAQSLARLLFALASQHPPRPPPDPTPKIIKNLLVFFNGSFEAEQVQRQQQRAHVARGELPPSCLQEYAFVQDLSVLLDFTRVLIKFNVSSDRCLSILRWRLLLEVLKLRLPASSIVLFLLTPLARNLLLLSLLHHSNPIQSPPVSGNLFRQLFSACLFSTRRFIQNLLGPICNMTSQIFCEDLWYAPNLNPLNIMLF
jgi:hypothetical protein